MTCKVSIIYVNLANSFSCFKFFFDHLLQRKDFSVCFIVMFLSISCPIAFLNQFVQHLCMYLYMLSAKLCPMSCSFYVFFDHCLLFVTDSHTDFWGREGLQVQGSPIWDSYFRIHSKTLIAKQTRSNWKLSFCQNQHANLKVKISSNFLKFAFKF